MPNNSVNLTSGFFRQDLNLNITIKDINTIPVKSVSVTDIK